MSTAEPRDRGTRESPPASREREGEPASPPAARYWTLLPYAVFLLLLAISWCRWIEPYVDSGRELMTPLRLARGERLYRDVRFYHGPLAPYLAAGLEKLHSRSLAARVALATAIALLHIESLRRLGKRGMSPARTALAVSGIVAAVFFAKPGGQIFPFSLDTALAVAAIAWALELSAGQPASANDWAAGGCLSVALLSRPEMGFIALAALAVDARRGRRLMKITLLPVAAAGLLYAVVSVGVPFEILRTEGWLALLGPPDPFRNIYAAYAGFDRPALRIAELGLAAALLALIAALLVLVASVSRELRISKGVRVAAQGLGLLLLVGAAGLSWRPPSSLAERLALLPPLIRVVPTLTLLAALWRLLCRLRRVPGKPESLSAVPDAVLLVSAVFGLRVLLTAGYAGPYGSFLLPLPLLVVAIGLFSLADRMSLPLGAAFPRLVTEALAVFLLFRMATLWDENRGRAWSPVRTPAGSVYLVEPIARATQQTLLALSTHLSPGASLIGFPEGGFFDYVLDRRSPLPEEQFFPGHLNAKAESEAIRRLSDHPPDAVLLCNVLAVGHGSLAFGRDYLVALGRFLDDRFFTVASFGPGAAENARIGDPQFFVTIRVPKPPD